VLAGDGTARSVASKAKPDGPMIAPLPGGTMNMLPKALYGTADWKLALKRALEEGEPQAVSGGEVEGEYFYCAAILGSPALWAP
ncbi:diacylglycerol kinase, partial [Enterococcus faecium]